MTELARSDLRVRELVALLGEPQNVVSYHLRQLRDGGLVSATRSSFDGRDSYYHLDLDRCAEALAGAGSALHPALSASPPRVRPIASTSVLFVCTGNSARSPIAEALLRHRTADRITVASGGTAPKESLHPAAPRTLWEEYRIDITGQRPVGLATHPRRRLDYLVTLCDKAREHIPAAIRPVRRIHWSIPDPARSDARRARTVFRRLAAELDARIQHLMPLFDEPKEAPV